jgi:transaldolase
MCRNFFKRETNMANSLLEQLRAMTVVVADTGDFESILKFKPQDSTTNPSLITAAAKLPAYRSLVDNVLRGAKQELGAGAGDTDIATLAFSRLAVAFGEKILAVIPGRVSTEVDARLSFDRQATLAQARDVIRQYEKSGISRQRILIKIAATWEGIQAARQLEEEGIHCNLTLVFGLHQAVACAEAKVTLISPFVGRILDWYKKRTGMTYSETDDPGVQSVSQIYNYLKKFEYKTVVMGASFRNVGEIRQLAGCDLLTISPTLLGELNATTGELPRKLSPDQARASAVARITVDKDTFEQMHRDDPMATEQLTQGIEGFRAALAELEKLLADRLSVLEEAGSPTVTATASG